MATYDLENLLDDIKSVVSTNLNTKLSAIDTEKNDGITLNQPATGAYAWQSLNEEIMNYDPFVFYYINDIKGEGMSNSPKKVSVIVAIIKADEGGQASIIRRMYRYQRALEEIFADNFEMISNGVKLRITSLVPMELTLNTSNLHRAAGIMLDADLG